jgi:hypothetical protein
VLVESRNSCVGTGLFQEKDFAANCDLASVSYYSDFRGDSHFEECSSRMWGHTLAFSYSKLLAKLEVSELEVDGLIRIVRATFKGCFEN